MVPPYPATGPLPRTIGLHTAVGTCCGFTTFCVCFATATFAACHLLPFSPTFHERFATPAVLPNVSSPCYIPPPTCIFYLPASFSCIPPHTTILYISFDFLPYYHHFTFSHQDTYYLPIPFYDYSTVHLLSSITTIRTGPISSIYVDFISSSHTRLILVPPPTCKILQHFHRGSTASNNMRFQLGLTHLPTAASFTCIYHADCCNYLAAMPGSLPASSYLPACCLPLIPPPLPYVCLLFLRLTPLCYTFPSACTHLCLHRNARV